MGSDGNAGSGGILKRQKKILFTAELIENLCRTGELHVYIAGVPKDAICTGLRLDDSQDCVQAFFEHDSFDLVPTNEEAPIEVVSFIVLRTKGDTYVERVDDDPSESDHGDVCVFR